MEKYLYVFVHVGVPMLILFAVLLQKPRTRLGTFFTSLCFVLVLLFLYFWGQWPIAVSWYFKYVVGAILVLTLIAFIKNWRRSEVLFPNDFWGVSKTLLVALFAILMLFPVYLIFAGRYTDRNPVELAFPLKDGRFYVSSGGSNRVINNHFGTPNNSQWYALDINKLGKWGMVSNPPMSGLNEAHSIFGEWVYAPCDGVVIDARNSVRDNSEASMEVDPEDGMGNYIILDCSGVRVTMSHLQYKSLKIRSGQSVRVGDPLARVGNSGFSQEPHLHFQAAKYTKDSIPVPIPIQFNGFAPVRNDVITN